jgi:hypothetical protein
LSKRLSVAELCKISKGRRVLGINPPVMDFAFFDLWSKPMGLLFLLGFLREEGASVSLLDMVFEAPFKAKRFGRAKVASTGFEKPAVFKMVPRKFRRFGMALADAERRFSELRPDVVLISSAMTYWYLGVKEVIESVKSVLPGVPTVLGGLYARLCPEHASSLGSDFIITEPWEPDLCSPAMDLYGSLPYGVAITSFGCPFACFYCASRELWNGYRRRPVERILAEMESQRALGAEDFAFYDDALLLDGENHFYPLCAAIRDRFGASVRLHTPNGLHVRAIDERCAHELKRTGFRTIRLSLESIDEEMAALSSFKAEREDYMKAVRCLSAEGYSQRELETYILLGLPGQSVKSVRDTIAFVKRAGGTPRLAEFSPIPGTPAFDIASKSVPEIVSEPLLHNNTVYSSWISGTVPPDTLQELRNLALT